MASVGGSSSNSQFVSLDAHGLLILWITTANTTAASSAIIPPSDEDYASSPWATVKLVKLKVIDIQREGSSKLTHPLSDSLCMATLPNDSSIILASYARGRVRKIARLGVPVSPSCLSRPLCSVTLDDNPSASLEAGIYFSQVTCISANALSHQKQLILVGRKDGTVDLFASNLGTASLTWDLSAFQKREKKSPRKPYFNNLFKHAL